MKNVSASYFQVCNENFPLELSSYISEDDVFYTESNWIPMYLCGEDLPGQSISKIAKYIILPLADWKISIMAISMYQCDYILVDLDNLTFLKIVNFFSNMNKNNT